MLRKDNELRANNDADDAKNAVCHIAISRRSSSRDQDASDPQVTASSTLAAANGAGGDATFKFPDQLTVTSWISDGVCSGLSSFCVGKDGLRCILKEPKSELGKFP